MTFVIRVFIEMIKVPTRRNYRGARKKSYQIIENFIIGNN